jgi:tetratricopeptide (TPR) repeat protein
MSERSTQEGVAGEYKAVLEKLDEIITRFPRTTDGRFALLYKGNVALRLGDHDGAIKAYSAFLDKGGKEKLYQYFAMEGLGEAYKGKKEYDKALQSYQKIVALGEGVPLSDAYFNMGLCYEKLGKSKEALESYKEFMKVAQKSKMTNIVLRKIALLEK